MERKENSILLRGTAAEAPVLSHRSRGLDFYRFPLEVPRLSGQEDRLNVLVPSGIMLPKEGDYVEVAGEIRSFNNRSASSRALNAPATSTLCGSLPQIAPPPIGISGP